MSANHAQAQSNAVNDAPSPHGDSDRSASDYDIILTALKETPRGRAFLAEHAHRNRNPDTATLLAAIGRIEGLLTSRGLEPSAAVPEPAAPAPVADEPAPVEAGVLQAIEQAMNQAMETDLTVIETVAVVEVAAVVEHPAVRQPASRDAFADIRALSNIEKIALFT